MTTTKLGNCARCMGATPAVTLERFTFGTSTYNLELCDPHADMFRRDMFVWSRIGVLDQELVPSRSEEERDRRRGVVFKAHIQVPAARKGSAEVVELEPAPTSPRAVEKALNGLGLPDGWQDWTFSAHASERRESRGVSPIEARWAAQEPDVVRPGNEPGTMIHTKGHVQVVLNPRERRIITVINRNLTSDNQEERAHAAS